MQLDLIQMKRLPEETVYIYSCRRDGKKEGKHHPIVPTKPQKASRSSMADIALLVAEEFQRRNRLAKERGGGGGGGGEEHNAGSCFSRILARGFQQVPLMDVGRKGSELAKRVLEPQTSLGLIASDGFFSA